MTDLRLTDAQWDRLIDTMAEGTPGAPPLSVGLWRQPLRCAGRGGMSGPHNAQAEAALIARLLVDPGQLPVLALGKLTPEDFYTPVWRDTFLAMERLSAGGPPLHHATPGG